MLYLFYCSLQLADYSLSGTANTTSTDDIVPLVRIERNSCFLLSILSDIFNSICPSLLNQILEIALLCLVKLMELCAGKDSR